ncbi:MAG: hypothetical protein A3E07_00020 [Candidatus Wildermuthbacteria bacterium RIFCSPHIGHO2_12_FULL_45_9]|uniref:Type II secretion system protein GspG C-terminal domain-containing protein n=1 Tax=Candidatus Wildermuthbacteria bacterium RIFCSPHIGHO2_02_FULL_45_25 TaxID=1802450 RepID=A0A1G2R3S0_9BACT|nr:MAG: hypothetical protein A2748_00740 [Candidatus Wildermuthbacteria bacterium RIFCSPHIGHO2_01_FULL_45_20]OHA67500.1 MAG: hypothetical protein A3C04_00280 [Candidatus Wildermuthbacteria bacterium RIFCSPHIGHO2_02_FULL_45_25]OHA72113.1 MAG: hypothetical protein A3E07_00020 [Candidatus Wildermuthbacteria bacterium RIFCSPHIGHO2_12_FULL_45_9]
MKHRQQAFTLIELLVVIAIIGILTGITIIALPKAIEFARITKAKAEIRDIVTSIRRLELDTGQWPGHQEINVIGNEIPNNEIWDLNEEVAGLTQNDSADPYPNWRGYYAAYIPLDPWGNPYFFDSDYDVDGIWVIAVGSFGPNGIGHNVYDEDDIIYELGR